MWAMKTGYRFSVMVALQYLIQVILPVEIPGEYQVPVPVNRPLV